MPKAHAAVPILCVVLSACTAAPEYVLNGPSSTAGKAGPKAAAVLANLTCELARIVRDDQELTFYLDDPSLRPGNALHNQPPRYDPDRVYSLRNILGEIKYVGEAQLTLDAYDLAGASPSISITPSAYGANAGATFSEQAHRQFQSNISLDLSRLAGMENVDVGGRSVPCGELKNYYSDYELGGDLKLREAIASGIQMHSMNRASVWPNVGASKLPLPDNGGGGSPPGGDKQRHAAVPGVTPDYTFGKIQASVDFNVIEGIGAGPSVATSLFNVPVKATQSINTWGVVDQYPLNADRQTKETLQIIFYPACILRHKKKGDKPPYEYSPEMVVGTPGWANYLEPCTSDSSRAGVVNALKAAHDQLDLESVPFGDRIGR